MVSTSSTAAHLCCCTHSATRACADGRSPYCSGKLSLTALTQHVGNSSVRCEVKNKDQYGRNVAACFLSSWGGKEDIGQWLVSNGHAVAYRCVLLYRDCSCCL